MKNYLKSLCYYDRHSLINETWQEFHQKFRSSHSCLGKTFHFDVNCIRCQIYNIQAVFDHGCEPFCPILGLIRYVFKDFTIIIRKPM